MKPIYTEHYEDMIGKIRNNDLRDRAAKMNELRLLLERQIKNPRIPVRRRRVAARYVEVMDDYKQAFKERGEGVERQYNLCVIAIELFVTVDELFDVHELLGGEVGSNSVRAFDALNIDEVVALDFKERAEKLRARKQNNDKKN